MAGRGGRVAKRTAEQSVGEAKVAKAKQRILAGQYGLRTPKNDRVKEAINDLSLSGKQAQRLREELRDRCCYAVFRLNDTCVFRLST